MFSPAQFKEELTEVKAEPMLSGKSFSVKIHALNS